MEKKLFALLAFVFFLNTNIFSQTAIVIPLYKQGEDRVAIIESDYCFRKVETVIMKAVIEAGGRGVDYIPRLRSGGLSIEGLYELIKST